MADRDDDDYDDDLEDDDDDDEVGVEDPEDCHDPECPIHGKGKEAAIEIGKITAMTREGILATMMSNAARLMDAEPAEFVSAIASCLASMIWGSQGLISLHEHQTGTVLTNEDKLADFVEQVRLRLKKLEDRGAPTLAAKQSQQN